MEILYNFFNYNWEYLDFIRLDKKPQLKTHNKILNDFAKKNQDHKRIRYIKYQIINFLGKEGLRELEKSQFINPYNEGV